MFHFLLKAIVNMANNCFESDRIPSSTLQGKPRLKQNFIRHSNIGKNTWFQELFRLPMLFPVIGLALGANGIIKETKKPSEDQDQSAKIFSIVGMLVCGYLVIMFFVKRTF